MALALIRPTVTGQVEETEAGTRWRWSSHSWIAASDGTSLRAIAAELDARSIPAPRGGRWTAPAVMRLLAR